MEQIHDNRMHLHYSIASGAWICSYWFDGHWFCGMGYDWHLAYLDMESRRAGYMAKNRGAGSTLQSHPGPETANQLARTTSRQQELPIHQHHHYLNWRSHLRSLAGRVQLQQHAESPDPSQLSPQRGSILKTLVRLLPYLLCLSCVGALTLCSYEFPRCKQSLSPQLACWESSTDMGKPTAPVVSSGSIAH